MLQFSKMDVSHLMLIELGDKVLYPCVNQLRIRFSHDDRGHNEPFGYAVRFLASEWPVEAVVACLIDVNNIASTGH